MKNHKKKNPWHFTDEIQHLSGNNEAFWRVVITNGIRMSSKMIPGIAVTKAAVSHAFIE